MVVDEMMITGFVVSYGLGKLLDEVIARLPTSLDALTRAKQELIEEAAKKVREALELQARKNVEFEVRLASALDEREAVALFLRLLPEAAVATTRERMEMLAYALAGLFQPDLSAEARSRVSRAVTQLEPSDVVELRKLVEAWDTKDLKDVTMPTPGRWVLLYTGCVAHPAGPPPPAFWPTDLGRAVLATLVNWPGARGA